MCFVFGVGLSGKMDHWWWCQPFSLFSCFIILATYCCWIVLVVSWCCCCMLIFHCIHFCFDGGSSGGMNQWWWCLPYRLLSFFIIPTTCWWWCFLCCSCCGLSLSFMFAFGCSWEFSGEMNQWWWSLPYRLVSCFIISTTDIHIYFCLDHHGSIELEV